MDELGALTLTYAREEMAGNPVFTAFEEEARSVVYCDLVAALAAFGEQLLNNGGEGEVPGSSGTKLATFNI